MLFQNRSFRELLAGSTLSQLGDVAFTIALPWLVLELTGSSLALGTVLTVVAVPRALLMLVGGALSDRLSSRAILIVTNTALSLAVGALALAAATHMISLWMIYAVALIFGFAEALSSPALRVLVPAIVMKDEIARANATLQSATQLCVLAGGAVAGVMIARIGLTPAFAIDACSFLFLIVALARMRVPEIPAAAHSPLLQSIAQGLRFVVQDGELRALLVLIAAVNIAVTGATQVGLISLAQARFNSAGDFGVLMTMCAIGSLAGMALTAKFSPRGHAVLVVSLATVPLSAGIACLALPMGLIPMSALLLLCGAVAGYVNVFIVSWLQTNIPSDIRGRVMSVVALSSIGVAPLSLAAAGAIAAQNLTLVFIAAAMLLAAAGVVAGLSSVLYARQALPRTSRSF